MITNTHRCTQWQPFPLGMLQPEGLLQFDDSKTWWYADVVTAQCEWETCVFCGARLSELIEEAV